MTAPRRWLLVACAVSLSACASAGKPTPRAIPLPTTTEDVVYEAGKGADPPILTREVKPRYPIAAMRAKIQGSVWLECVVRPNGVCTDIKVVRSLDRRFGLDQEAIKALAKSRFTPGTKDGQPVPVLVTIEMIFRLK